jgi:hypothetical protein
MLIVCTRMNEKYSVNEQHLEGNKPSVFQYAQAIICNIVLIFYRDDRSRKYLRNIRILSYYTVPIMLVRASDRTQADPVSALWRHADIISGLTENWPRLDCQWQGASGDMCVTSRRESWLQFLFVTQNSDETQWLYAMSECDVVIL